MGRWVLDPSLDSLTRFLNLLMYWTCNSRFSLRLSSQKIPYGYRSRIFQAFHYEMTCIHWIFVTPVCRIDFFLKNRRQILVAFLHSSSAKLILSQVPRPLSCGWGTLFYFYKRLYVPHSNIKVVCHFCAHALSMHSRYHLKTFLRLNPWYHST